MEYKNEFGATCPAPHPDRAQVLLGHGGGGRLTQELIERVFLRHFESSVLRRQHDGAVFDVGDQRVAFTTDSFVVRPLFFPGGDIGRLAVFGTVNDLVMCGARPAWLSVGFIIEEGLPLSVLERITQSMSAAAVEAGVQIVTGDTKVVDRGKGDGLYLNTTGLGLIPPHGELGPERIRPGDAIVVSGDLGRHGVAILSVREGLQFESAIESDCAPLTGLLDALRGAGFELHCARDLTRGGLAAALNELAATAGVTMEIDEPAIPVGDAVRGACEILGLDPLEVANEGRCVVILPAASADQAVATLRQVPGGQGASRVGSVREGSPGVWGRGPLGSVRPITRPSGEQLPRIC